MDEYTQTYYNSSATEETMWKVTDMTQKRYCCACTIGGASFVDAVQFRQETNSHTLDLRALHNRKVA